MEDDGVDRNNDGGISRMGQKRGGINKPSGHITSRSNQLSSIILYKVSNNRPLTAAVTESQ